jgi:protoheme IX farnesyltransferase
MISTQTSTGVSLDLIQSVRILGELLKTRLSLLVAFSSAFGFILAEPGAIRLEVLLAVSLGGFLVSGGATTINRILEIPYDAVMSRTSNRPLPEGKISKNQAWAVAILSSVFGLGLLAIYTNVLTVALSALSLILYSFVYTPLKRVGPIAVFVGAIPGALPPLLGWVAASGTIGVEAVILFGIQFFWQFPHFWAIAWVADDDYKKAGFKLLPMGGKKDFKTAIQIMSYTLFLLPLGLLPTKLGVTGINSAIVATLCGALFLFQTFQLMGDCSRKSALRLMFGSFIYLPVVQIAYLLDKI